MGKNKDKKKLHAAATAEKQKKKATKNLLKEVGESTIDLILADITAHDTAATTVTITPLLPPDPTSPSPRANCSLTAHPSKPFLLLFGGEYYDGAKTSVYADLFLYHIPGKQWRRVTSPSPPAPRSAHQSVIVTRGDVQSMLVFGGEFQSPSASQFHHFAQLYSLSLDSYHWTLLGGGSGKGSGGGANWPPGRSGHRMMVHANRTLIMFGGFIDDGRDVRFLNDLWLYDLATSMWRCVSKERKADVDHPNRWPSPRSGFCLWVDDERDTAWLFGGFVVHRENKKGKAGGVGGGRGWSDGVEEHLTDLWALNLSTLQWTAVKKRGVFPNERSGISCAWVPLGSKKRALLFGGVSDEQTGKDTANAKHEVQSSKSQEQGKKGKQGRGRAVADEEDEGEEDEEEEEDEERSVLYNDLFTFTMEQQHFHLHHTKGQVTTAFKQSIPKKKADDKKEPSPANDADQSAPPTPTPSSIFDFDPVLNALPAPVAASSAAIAAVDAGVWPCPGVRRSGAMCVKDGVLWLYGGVCEGREREHTYGDLWALELGGAEWKEMEKDRETDDWKGSDDEKDEDEEEQDEKASAKSSKDEADEDEEDDRDEEAGEAEKEKNEEEAEGVDSKADEAG